MTHRTSMAHAAPCTISPTTEKENLAPSAHTKGFDSPDRFISVNEYCYLLGCGRTKYYADQADPSSGAPRPIRIGRSRRHLLSETQAYISALAAKRDQAVAA